MSDDDLDLAAEFALGSLGGLRRAEAEKRLQTDAPFRHAVRAWESRLSALDDGEIVPPARVFDRIGRAIDAGEAVPGTATQFGDTAIWQADFLPGVDRRMLHCDAASGRQTFLLRMAPGSVVPGHSHAHDEECFVVEGAVRVGTLYMKAGDFHLAKAGGDHLPFVADQGALLMISSVY